MTSSDALKKMILGTTQESEESREGFDEIGLLADPNVPATLRGVGLHTGRIFQIFIRPREDSEGIRFVAKNPEGEIFVAPALWSRLSATARSTALVLRSESGRKAELRTVEHFLAACAVLGFPSWDVEILAADDELSILELPNLDGSALQWLKFLAPLPRVAVSQTCWVVMKEFEVGEPGRSVRFEPWSQAQSTHNVPQVTRLDCEVNFPRVWQQAISFEIDRLRPERGLDHFIRFLAPARTFGFRAELEQLAAKGLARGGSLENALLLDEEQVVNPEGFLVPQELAAHKLVDAIGDFSLLGGVLFGKVSLHCAGHALHLKALQQAVRSGALVKCWLTPNGPSFSDS